MPEDRRSENPEADSLRRIPDPDRMPVDLRTLMLRIPNLKTDDVIAFDAWLRPGAGLHLAQSVEH